LRRVGVFGVCDLR